MLKPAQLYREQLEQKMYESWYNLENQYWNGGCWDSSVKLQEENWDSHQFVSVNNKDEVIGYISYAVDHQALKAYNFGIISFHKGNPLFAKDLYLIIYNIFYHFNLNKVEFIAYVDNPVTDAYIKFIDKVGGIIIGIRRKTAMLIDHKLHDSIEFEIMRDEFKPLKNWRFKR